MIYADFITRPQNILTLSEERISYMGIRSKLLKNTHIKPTKNPALHYYNFKLEKLIKKNYCTFFTLSWTGITASSINTISIRDGNPFRYLFDCLTHILIFLNTFRYFFDI